LRVRTYLFSFSPIFLSAFPSTTTTTTTTTTSTNSYHIIITITTLFDEPAFPYHAFLVQSHLFLSPLLLFSPSFNLILSPSPIPLSLTHPLFLFPLALSLTSVRPLFPVLSLPPSFPSPEERYFYLLLISNESASIPGRGTKTAG